MSGAARILVIDDDAELGELLSELFAQEGYEVEHAPDGATGLTRALEGAHSLVVLDVMLPGLSGFEVLTRLRKSSMIPVLMLTARGDDVDRIVGLEMGADDYLPKPFNPRELIARVRALHRRALAAQAPPEEAGSGPTVLGDLEIHPRSRSAKLAGRELKLTTAEFDLLEVLTKNAGAVVSREELTKLVLGRRLSPFDRAIDMHVSNLRKKLGARSSGDERIKTIRGAGYLLAREA